MFVLRSKEQIQKAIDRAKAHHAVVKFRRFGEYMVKGSAGNFYAVRCEKRNGLKIVDCECPAGKFGTPCFHAASALSLHIGLATQRA